MSIQQNEFLKFLKLLSDNDCLAHVILIDSWAEYMYHETSLMPNFHPNIKTLDADFLIRNLRRPVPTKNIAALARSEGYLIDQDIVMGTTRIVSKAGLEIEFLISKTGAGMEHSLLTNLGVSAQSLRHMQVLLKHIVTVPYLSMQVTVPVPEAYVIHKMIIHDQRGIKQAKDKQAIRSLWPYMDPAEFNKIYESLTNKEKGS